MVTCSLDAMKKFWRRKDMKGKSRGVTTNYIHQKGDRKDEMMKFLALTLYSVVRMTLTLISSPAIIGCFRKISFQGFNLVI